MKKRYLLRSFLVVACILVTLFPLVANAEENQTGWVYDGDDCYYYAGDGSLTQSKVIQIDGAYYGFDYSGKMYSNTHFSSYDDTENAWADYRAKADGTLYVNEWYESEYSSKYYYGESGKAPDGLYTVNGTQYYFYNGYMCADSLVQIENTGDTYAVNKDGEAVQLALGWNYYFGNYYYLSEDGAYTDTVKEINGAYYGFDGNGRMHVNADFNLYDHALSRWVYYRAKDDGSLYVNEWYEGKYGNWYYYGECGKTPWGSYTVNGTLYYFSSDGRMRTDELVQDIDTENAWLVSEDGVAVQLISGWNYCFGSYYYMSEDGACTDTVKEINGAYYGFDGNGRMYANTSFSHYDSAQGEWGYYRAKADGSLYVNEWYKDEDGSFYYYGESGKALDGLHTVNGTQYYFDFNGYMCVDQLVQIESTGNTYVVNEDGVAVQLSLGWNYCFENYYYMSEDGVYIGCVVEIDGKYYWFDWAGAMFSNTELGFYDMEREYWVYYRAKLDGSLYVNEWYQDKNGSYYYGEMGKAAYGLTQIGDAQYFFEYNGSLCKNGIFSEDGVTCYCDGNGIATVMNNGWNYINRSYYYVAGGTYYSGCIAQIDGAYYAFDAMGILYVGKEFCEYGLVSPDGKQISGYFCARADGSLLVNEWVYSESGWKYYGENGCRPDGLQLINGNYYYFTYGVAVENRNMIVGNECYSFATGGYGYKVEPNTWVLLDDGEWSYVQDDGTVFSDGILEINGVKYLFSYKTLATDATVWISSVYYLSDSEGRLIAQEGWHTCNGDYYYVESDASLALGWKEMGGHRYYFTPAMKHDALFRHDEKIYIADTSGDIQQVTEDGFYSFAHEYDSETFEQYASYYIENGKLLKEQWKYFNGNWYYLNSNGKAAVGLWEIDDIIYYFDVNGTMQTNTWTMQYSTIFYVDASGRVVTGLQTIDGVQYIFDNWGQLITGCIYNLNGVSYAIREDGAVIGQATTENGWNLINGTWYYAIDGELLTNDIVLCNEKIYGFDRSGRMIVNECEHGYYFGADGTALTGWIPYGNTYMYAFETGELLYNDIQTIDGQRYLFQSCYMQTGLVIYNNQLVDCGDDGVIRSISTIPDGYSYVDGDVFYYPNGEVFTGWDGNRYFQDGMMLKDSTISINGNIYLFKANGELLTDGFYEIAYVFCGYAENGTLVHDDWRFIDGFWYYFNSSGAMIRNQIGYIDDIYYCFDKDGHYIGRYQEGELDAEGVSDGWHYIDGSYYYAYAGQYVSDTMMYIDGDQYAFDQNGKMLTNEWRLDLTRFSGYAVVYFGADGKRLDATGWTLIDGQWVYFKTDHTVCDGWIVDNGKRYMQELEFISDGYGFRARPKGLLTGCYVIDNLLHYFNQSGELEYAVTCDNGWYQAEDGAWYYFKNGRTTYGYTLVNGVEYYFDAYKMSTNEVCNTDNGWRYASASGALVTQQGWINTEKGWIYIQENGKVAYSGAYLIDGVSYGFRNGYLVS